MPSSQKASAQLMVAMKTTHKLSLRPESGTSYSTQNQHTTDRHYDCGEKGYRTTVFSLLILPTPFNESSKTYAKGTSISFPLFAPSLMLNHIQRNLAEQGMAVCVQVQRPSNSCLFITHHDSIMETMFQLVATSMSLGEISTEHKRSRC